MKKEELSLIFFCLFNCLTKNTNESIQNICIIFVYHKKKKTTITMSLSIDSDTPNIYAHWISLLLINRSTFKFKSLNMLIKIMIKSNS